MRVAILADIHGNLPACEAVLQDIARNGADVIVAAGDLALRGAHPRETVELSGERVGDRAQLSVKDTGLGIEAKHLPRLFERFYRVDRGRSREQGGTGLGLSIVRHLVHGMEGEVRVASQLGVGSTFTVVLPVV